MANSQHRCVFVGNIPYDATEEQLVQICEEVGPVVSFRLVIDRETGKPKGYGFCEYKDEETALSARRNLHGYDINGRQLRVDFAENDKNADRSREQGRGGPGLPTNIAPQKQIGGPAVQGDPNLQQAVGFQVAMAAAIVMAGALGGAQTNSSVSQNGFQIQPIQGNDPLTHHLAKMPKGQLIEILTELKVMATQNKEQVRQLLLVQPQLSKAVLQAHIMLKLVPPQMLQMPNTRQTPGSLPQPPLQGGQPAHQPSVQAVPGLPPLAHSKVPVGLTPQTLNQASPGFPASLVPSQYPAAPLVSQPRFQSPQVLQHPALSGALGASNQQPVSLSNRVDTQMAASSSIRPPVQLSIPTHPPLQNNVFQPSSSMASAIPNSVNKDSGHPPKLLKMEGGRAAPFLPTDVNHTTSVLGSSQAVGISGNQILKAGALDSQKQNPELLPGIEESALLQQVLNLTPEQLSSLPPEQQQQVIQLQQMLRQST